MVLDHTSNSFPFRREQEYNYHMSSSIGSLIYLQDSLISMLSCYIIQLMWISIMIIITQTKLFYYCSQSILIDDIDPISSLSSFKPRSLYFEIVRDYSVLQIQFRGISHIHVFRTHSWISGHLSWIGIMMDLCLHIISISRDEMCYVSHDVMK